MRSIMRITKEMLTRYAQVFFVIIAFALMVALSYFFLSETERRHLNRSAESAILFTETNIKSDMLELETLLDVASETINAMLINKADGRTVNDYILFINNYVEAGSKKRLYGATGIFGVFDVFDGMMLIGYDSWIPPDDYFQTDRPWYTGAIKAEGEISASEPYLNVYSNQTTITLSRRIFDEAGNALGIVCLNIELERIQQYVVSTQFVEDGYGFLLSENHMIIAHPDPDMVGLSFRTVQSGIADLIDVFTEKESLAEVITNDYRGVRSIVFIQKLQNNWYMGVVTPIGRYFQSTRSLAMTLTMFGVIFAALLIGVLLKISAEKTMTDERMKLMFNSIPLVAYIFDKNYKIIDCNKNAVTLFDLSSQQEFCDKFYELLPEYQPDGRLTTEVGKEFNQKILEEGTYRFEWTYQKFDGELVPCEITCTRVMYKNDFTIVGYMRDLREQKQMLKEIQKHSRLLDTVNSAATILLSSNSTESFESALLKSFELVGYFLDVDRVQIWRNEELDDDMHFVLRYEWLSDFGKTCRPVPIGLHYPYSLKIDWQKKFSHGEYINAPIGQLSPEDQAFWGYYQIKSIVMIPMFLDDVFWGFFSIHDCKKERTFSTEEISILASAGLMMSSAVNRNIQTTRMRDAEERALVMMDAAPFCAIFWDQNLKLVDCNQEAVRMFDLSGKQEFIDRFLYMSPENQPDGVPSKEKGPALVKKALDEGYSEFEWMHKKLNGELIPVEVTCIRAKHRDQYTVTEYLRDLREQQAMLREMKKAEIAEESSKAKSDFLAKMSHEIRTPMNAILGITEIQLQDNSLPLSTKEALERIYNSGDLLLGIINDILDLSKIEAGKLVLLPAQYDIASLIHDTTQLNIMRYESKPIEFKLNVDENMPLMFMGDELRIKQILNNLLSNAFKYTDEGQITLSISVEEAEKREDSDITLVFAVSDTGQGMTGEQIRRLGSEYARFNTEANRKTEGTGLGMNITRNLIQLMSGTISIDSTPGMGSTFTVRLPQKRTDPSVLGKELAENLMQLNAGNTPKIRTVQLNKEFMPYGRVLVVDDVETNLYVAKGLMAPYGLSIDTALSGFEAVDKVRDGGSYDIIFMDHMMPRMDGIEATKIIRSLGYTNPIVALTANAIAGQAEMFIQSGFDDFISKPIDIRQLNMLLNKLIRDKKPEEVVEAAKKQKDKLSGDSDNRLRQLDRQLAEFFVHDAKKAMSALETVYKNKFHKDDDLSSFIINIHAIKSALANIGEDGLSAQAAGLEQKGRDKNIKQIMADILPFMEKLYAVTDKLESIQEKSNEAPGDNDNQYLKEKLLAIKAACASLNKKVAKNILTEIKQKTWQQDFKEQLAILAACLLHSEFDEAVQLIDNFVKRL